jgi:hypothetical protein
MIHVRALKICKYNEMHNASFTGLGPMWQFNVVVLYICNKQNAYNPDPNDTEDSTKKNHDYLNQDRRPLGCELRSALEDLKFLRR